jgi:hypothetical protein
MRIRTLFIYVDGIITQGCYIQLLQPPVVENGATLQQFVVTIHPARNSERLSSCEDARLLRPSRTMPKKAKNGLNECRSLPTDISKALTSTLGYGHLPRDERLYFNVVLRCFGH